MNRSALAAVAGLLGACSAPATLNDLAIAERRDSAGDVEGALVAYRQAQVTCHRLKPARRALATCADALLGEGEVLEHAQRTTEAITVYLAIPPRVVDDPATSATAVYRAGQLQLRGEQIVPAWTSLWRVVTDWPDEPIAADALRTLLEDGRRRNAKALADQMASVLSAVADTDVADNLVWSLADLTEHELDNPTAARSLYDRIPLDYPKSGLRDDARWHGARISRALGDPRGAVERLRGLVGTREVAMGAGSYFSVWLDDAQLLLGQILRDDLDDLAGAASAFRKLPKDYPASILKDDALFELAVTLAKARDVTGACAAIAALAKVPDSKYHPRATELAKELPCP